MGLQGHDGGAEIDLLRLQWLGALLPVAMTGMWVAGVLAEPGLIRFVLRLGLFVLRRGLIVLRPGLLVLGLVRIGLGVVLEEVEVALDQFFVIGGVAAFEGAEEVAAEFLDLFFAG